MKAFVMDSYGQPLSLVDMDKPAPASHEVLVRMVAAGVNHADERTRAGEFKAIFRLGLPKVMGGEFSGEIVAVGDSVVGFSPGDRVFGYTGVVGMGTWAEFIVVDAKALAHVPASIPLVDAAALPVVTLTAWHALVTLGRVKPGHTVLVHGGAGGVGSAVIQLAKHLGATVATTVSARSCDSVRALGADIVIDYRSEDFVAKLVGTPIDIVIDTQGGDVTSRSLRVLRRGGIVIGIAGTPDPHLADQAGAGRVIKTALTILSARVRWQARRLGVRYRFLFIEPDGTALAAIAKLVDDGIVRPIIDRVLPFDDTDAALDQLLAGPHDGKILVTTSPDAVGIRAPR